MDQMCRQRGFTLMEVIIVVVILLMMSAIVLAQLGEARAKSRDAQRLADLQQIGNALEVYRQEHGTFPSEDSIVGSGGAVDSAILQSLPEVPVDPLNDSQHQYQYDHQSADCDGETIVYATRLEVRAGEAKGCSGLSGDVHVVFPG